MHTPATRLDIPGQPALLDEREGEPVLSRFTGKPLRRIRWILQVNGDNAQEQLNAALTAASGDGELIPMVREASGRWPATASPIRLGRPRPYIAMKWSSPSTRTCGWSASNSRT